MPAIVPRNSGVTIEQHEKTSESVARVLVLLGAAGMAGGWVIGSCVFLEAQTHFQIFLCDSLNLYNFDAACQARHDAHARPRHACELRQEAHALLIRLPIHRRGRQRELPGVADAARQGGALGPRMHLYRETRHATLALKFATPAATRVSTTSKAMVSSSQSWLEPSGPCVATVSVYCCGVSQHSTWKSTSSSSPGSKSPSSICSMRVLVP